MPKKLVASFFLDMVYIYTFLSDSPTGQTPGQIVTRDGSNDAVSGKGVPFEG